LGHDVLDQGTARAGRPIIWAKLTSLAALTALGNKKIWVDAKEAVGPLPITPSQKDSGFNSSIKITGYRQYVTESPDEVRAVLRPLAATRSRLDDQGCRRMVHDRRTINRTDSSTWTRSPC
jgi:hypothetical protein